MFQPNPSGKRNNFLEHHFCVRKKRQKVATTRQSLQYIFMILNTIYMVHVIKIIPNFCPSPRVSFEFTKYLIIHSISYKAHFLLHKLLNLPSDSPQHTCTHNAAIILSCNFNIVVVSPIFTSSAYEVFSQRKLRVVTNRE